MSNEKCMINFWNSRIIFFLAVALTSGAMLIERNEGILERSLVSGKLKYCHNLYIGIKDRNKTNINISITI